MMLIDLFLNIFNTVFTFVTEQYKNILEFKNVDFSHSDNMFTSLGILGVGLFGFVKIIFAIVVIYFVKDILSFVFRFIYIVLFFAQNIFKIIPFPFNCLAQFFKRKKVNYYRGNYKKYTYNYSQPYYKQNYYSNYSNSTKKSPSFWRWYFWSKRKNKNFN